MYIQYIYSARTPLYYLLLIVFVKRVAFIFDIAAFDFSGSSRTDDGDGNSDGPT